MLLKLAGREVTWRSGGLRITAMAIPTFKDLMLPLLRAFGEGGEHHIREMRERLADELELSDDDRKEELPSGQRVLSNRVGWARTYLNKAGLIESTRLGWWSITEDGQKLLAEAPSRIDYHLLDRFESFAEWRRQKPKSDGDAGEEAVESAATPDETMEAAFREHREQVQAELLDTVKSVSPYFFEKVVLRLLRAMGYGGATGRGEVTPKSGDGGIDGVIYEDKLGLDTVVIQAKRWQGTVGREAVQAFVGSMDFHRSRKGVFLTTGSFSREALEYIDRIEGKKVVLIDGEELAGLMVDYRVGVTPTKTYELVDVSQDFFDEDL